MNAMNKLIDKVKQARKDLKMTQADLARKTDLSIESIRRFEQGKYVSSQIIRRILYVLNLPAPRLFPYYIKVSKNFKEYEESDGGITPEVRKIWRRAKKREEFNAKLEEIFKQLISVVDIYDKTILDNIDHRVGFKEIFWLIKKYGIKV